MDERFGSKAAEQDRDAHDRAPRESLLLMGNLSIDGRDLGAVRIRNLSATGLMADSNDPPECGTHVTIELRNIGAVKGTVVWKRPGKFGMAFDGEIDPSNARKPVGSGDGNANIPEYMRFYRPTR